MYKEVANLCHTVHVHIINTFKYESKDYLEDWHLVETSVRGVFLEK